MKNIVKLFGLIVLVAVIGFSMAACKNDDDGDPEKTISGNSIASGAPVDIPEAAKSQTDFSYTYNYYYYNDDNKPRLEALSTFIDEPASVKIKDGKVDVQLGKPKSAYLEKLKGDTAITISPDDAKCFQLTEGFYTADGNYSLYPKKNKNEEAMLIYADKNVTIKGTATFNDGGGTFTQVIDASLKQGWNFLIMSQSGATTKITASTTLPDDFKWTVISDN